MISISDPHLLVGGSLDATNDDVITMVDRLRHDRRTRLAAWLVRKRREMTQDQVAARMGISVARVSQIEGGSISTQDVLGRYIAALGGTLKIIADFGDEQLKIA